MPNIQSPLIPDSAPVIRDDPTWKAGDFALITPDSVRFRVEERYLRAASDVFNDLIMDCQGERELTHLDPELEHSSTIAIWLGLVLNVELRIPDGSDNDEMHHLVGLLDFLDKWGCTMPRKALITCLLSFPPISARNQFVMGALLSDPDICTEALWTALHEVRSEDTSTLCLRNHHGVMDIGRLSFDVFQRIPADYQWALPRTCDEEFRIKHLSVSFNDHLRRAKSQHSARAAQRLVPVKLKTSPSDSEDDPE